VRKLALIAYYVDLIFRSVFRRRYLGDSEIILFQSLKCKMYLRRGDPIIIVDN